jgi:adenylate cyclase
VRRVDRARLVAFFGTYNDLAWVLDREDREILLRLTPDGFDDDRGTWGIVLAQGHALQGDAEDVRLYAEEARKAFEAQLRDTPNDPTLHSLIGLSLAYLGREDEAVKEGLRSVELVSSDAMLSPYFQHVLARIYMLVGEHEKAIDELEKLQKTPYFVSSGWLKIDPNFDPLRSNPRFQKLVAATK